MLFWIHFFGTGTTGAVAKKLKRQFIGIEKEATYVDIARRRIAAVTPIHSKDLLETQPRRALPKIPFGSLLERGLLNPGDRLFDSRKQFSAQVRADGSLVAKDKQSGSIHVLGAKLQNLPSCNGWTFWHVEKAGKTLVIDELRNQIRAENEISTAH